MYSGTGALLLTAVAGYWALERAEHHKGNLKRVGQLVGSFVIAVSLIGVVCRVWYVVKGDGTYCPFMSKASSPQTQTPPPASSKK